jgi:hypothetical protein
MGMPEYYYSDMTRAIAAIVCGGAFAAWQAAPDPVPENTGRADMRPI